MRRSCTSLGSTGWPAIRSEGYSSWNQLPVLGQSHQTRREVGSLSRAQSFRSSLPSRVPLVLELPPAGPAALPASPSGGGPVLDGESAMRVCGPRSSSSRSGLAGRVPGSGPLQTIQAPIPRTVAWASRMILYSRASSRIASRADGGGGDCPPPPMRRKTVVLRGPLWGLATACATLRPPVPPSRVEAG